MSWGDKLLLDFQKYQLANGDAPSFHYCHLGLNRLCYKYGHGGRVKSVIVRDGLSCP